MSQRDGKQREWYPTRRQLRILHRALQIAMAATLKNNTNGVTRWHSFYKLAQEMPDGRKH